MSNIPTVNRAMFIRQTDAGHENDDNKKIEVHFNPVSLQYVISNTLKKVGRGNSAKQQVSQSTGKLTMDLVFDTTHEGYDVRIDTIKVARYLKPVNKDLPIVKFVWGTFSFQGMFESYKETIDYFSAEGVPLRASLNITLASQDIVFTADARTAGEKDATNPGAKPPANLLPPYKPEISPPAVSAGMDRGLGLSAGVSIGAGIGAGVSGGFGLEGSAGAGLSLGASIGIESSASLNVGANISAGVNASQGAFSGLRTNISPKVTAEVKFSPPIDFDSTLSVGTGATAGFSVGGKASAQGSLSMKANVGASGALQARIQFNEG